MKIPRIILAGGSGFLGQALAKHYLSLGWEPVILTRSPRRHGIVCEVAWDAGSPGDWMQELEGAGAVVNLTGRTVNCRYTAANRKQMMDSRVNSTRILGKAIAQCSQPPPVWLNSSSATLYRHTFGPAWDETGTDFSATPEVNDAFSVEVIRAWERELEDSMTPLTRKIALRTTIVLGHGDNSVFPVLCRLARLGLGGRMGSGKQFVSWLHQSDFCRAVEWLINNENISGPVNLAAPHPLSNAEMMRLFRELVRAPFGLPATKWMLEIGAFFLRTETELILKSRRVIPGKLLADGFEFRFPTMRDALQDLFLNPTSSPKIL
ncbi:MAG: TIGR01777 family oxidoreductase [Verrucomicrobia bacterium]|nr:TIGR01777 family oxidoreductase [Verrucomicrobiota bacterium]